MLLYVQICYKGPPIVKLGCGAEFSMILDCKGALHSFGLPEYGQLGKLTCHGIILFLLPLP
jgi:alpha-tubulin suppressor-like RCC1 family protein